MVQEWQFQQSVEAIVFACAWKKQNVGLNLDADVHMDFPFLFAVLACHWHQSYMLFSLA